MASLTNRLLVSALALLTLGAAAASAQQFDPLHHIVTANSPLHVPIPLREISKHLDKTLRGSATEKGTAIRATLKEMTNALKADLQPTMFIESGELKIIIGGNTASTIVNAGSMNDFLVRLGNELNGVLQNSLSNRYGALLMNDPTLRDALKPLIDGAMTELVRALGSYGATSGITMLSKDFGNSSYEITQFVIDRLRKRLLVEARRIKSDFNPANAQEWVTFISNVTNGVQSIDMIVAEVVQNSSSLLDQWRYIFGKPERERDSIILHGIRELLKNETPSLDLTVEKGWEELRSGTGTLGTVGTWLRQLVKSVPDQGTFKPEIWTRIVVAQIMSAEHALSKIALTDMLGGVLDIAGASIDRAIDDIAAGIESTLADIQHVLFSALPGLSVAESMGNVRAGMHLGWTNSWPGVKGYWQWGITIKGEFSGDRLTIPQGLVGLNGRIIAWVAQFDGALTLVRSNRTGLEWGLGMTFNLGDMILGASGFGVLDVIQWVDPLFPESWSASATIRAASNNTPIISFGAARFSGAPITPLLQVSYNVLF